ncbi:hypothetical protein DUNSADRAFT_15202 [Dunaliella salina]|uniref:Uncharacterized protein n=1 Tax=Dunaliella salina TaxID=3046 RepID=A0ABQ7G5U2_DUNSA|nr:hypothetical protein DUNSADRAFT_15202 [Dunaliella salina]|eukprot:KAF5829982.1 hypothetical protein DUNSADRAFT_15202 [Dunaliella salina]
MGTHFTYKPLGEPPITELRPSSASAVIRAKSRASQLIQRYAGSHWQQAQRTKWLIDVVMHIDRDYREYILEQEATINNQQQQIQELQATYAENTNNNHAQIEHLEDLIRQQQSQLRDNADTIFNIQTRLKETEQALSYADQVATNAAQELAALHQSVAALTEHDVRACKRLSNRAHEMKEALRKSQSNVRHSTEAARRHNLEVAAMMRLKDEQLAQDKNNMSNQYMSQIAAIHQVERATARLDLTKMKMELDAYKEPFMYQHGSACPTSNPQLAKTLGKKPALTRIRRA